MAERKGVNAVVELVLRNSSMTVLGVNESPELVRKMFKEAMSKENGVVEFSAVQPDKTGNMPDKLPENDIVWLIPASVIALASVNKHVVQNIIVPRLA